MRRNQHTIVRGSDWHVVGVLFLVGVFNTMDRQLLSVLLEPIRRDLAASDTVMGLLTGFAFVSFNALVSIPIARAADFRSRRDIIAAALAFWSVMTAAAGFVTSAAQLALARVGLGIGEAATAPASQSVLSDLFPLDRRTVPLTVLLVSTPVGFMVAFLAGGALSEALGWRMTFIVVGLPGLLLAAIVRLTIAEPPRGRLAAPGADPDCIDFAATVRYLWGFQSLRYLAAGATLSVFAGWAFLVWSPAFLARAHGMSTGEAGFWLGLAAGIGGVVGMLAAGFITGRLARRDRRWLLGVPAVVSFLGVPFVVAFLTLPGGAAAASMAFGVILFGPAILGPTATVTQSLAKVRMRAVAASLVMLTFNLGGLGLGPLTVGILSDLFAATRGTEGLRLALLVPIVSALTGAGVLFAAGARRLPSDLQRAEAGSDPASPAARAAIPFSRVDVESRSQP
jgi:MFS family permease